MANLKEMGFALIIIIAINIIPFLYTMCIIYHPIVKKSIISLLLLIFSIAITIIAPIIHTVFILSIIINICLMFVMYLVKRLRFYKKMLIFYIIFFILRIMGLGYGLLIIHSNPIPRNVYEVYKKMGFAVIPAAGDVGYFEHHLWQRRKKTQEMIMNAYSDFDLSHYNNSLSSGTIELNDPYTKDEKIRWITRNSDIYLYSVGPDHVDDGALIVYDPTNGFGAKGDLIFPKLELGVRAPQ